MPLTKIKSLGITDGTITGDDINSTFNLTGKTVTLPAGTGGKVLQVVQATVTSASSSTVVAHTDTFANYLTIISGSITPSSSSNKVLIFYNVNVSGSFGSSAIHLGRGSTAIFLGDSASNRVRSVISSNLGDQYDNRLTSGVYLDSPSTTSSTTYYVKHSSYTGAGTVYINRSQADRNDANGYDGRSACSLVLLEIAG